MSLPLAGPPIHVCHGCCGNEADSLERAVSLVQKVFLHAISVPALNKWTTVAPCVNLVSAMQHFCDVLPQAFVLCFPKGPQAESTESEDEGRDLGAPLDQTKMWRKLAMKRQIKASQFMQDADSHWLTLLWAVLTSPIMVVHYKLFKQGTWVTERKKKEEDEAAPDNTVVFSNHALNPATKGLAALTDMLLDTVQVVAWGPLVGMYGPVLAWPQARLRATRRTLFTAMGQLWRKLLEPWERYPWVLADLPLLSLENQQQKALDFFAQPDCCLDSFSAKLKAVVGSPETLLEEDTLTFLSEVFDRVVPTSTFIERAFARLNRWCDRKGPKPKLSTLSAKHVCYHFKNLTEQWRDKLRKAGVLSKRAGNKSRPSWAHGVRRGKCKNGLHVFAKEMGLHPSEGLIRQWALLSQDERKHYSQLARAENMQAKAMANIQPAADEEQVGGFWQMSSSENFPMARHIIQEQSPALRSLSNEFTVRSRGLQPDAHDSLEGAPETNLTLWAGCKSQACPHGLVQAEHASFEQVHKMLMDTIVRKGPKPTDFVNEPFVLELRSSAMSRFVVVAYSTRKKPIEAALVELQAVEVDPGLLLVLACERGVQGHLHVLSDVEFCLSLASVANEWDFFLLQVGPVRRLDQFDIVAAERLDYTKMLQEMAEENEMRLAMLALKRMTQKRKAKEPTQPGQRKPQPRRPPKAAASKRESPFEQDGGSSRSRASSVASQDEQEDGVEAVEGPGPAPVEAVVPPPAMVDARPVRQNRRRGRVWGTNPCFQIAPIHAQGSREPTGWGAICALHHDPSNGGLVCKKAMAKGHLSDEECQLRLKRWLVAGLDTAGWSDNQRQFHVSMGGLQMSQFAEGLSSQDLDQKVSHGV